MTTRDDNLLGDDSRLKRYDDLRSMIGDVENPTPMVALRRVVPSLSTASLYVKLEWMNPFGSVKDRAAKWMLEALEQEGALEGRTILEPTSGNTGIAIAAMAALLDHPMVATVPHSMPFEKEVLLRALGAQVVHTPAGPTGGRHPMDVAMDIAEEMIAVSDEYVMPNQYDNPDNVRAHYESTGPEIWAQTEGRVRNVFAGFGTTGTITGVGRFLKEQDPSINVIAIEPVPGHRSSGLKNLEETSVPGILDRSVIDEIVFVDDADARRMSARLHREEAIMIGSSGAAIVAGALKWLDANDAEGVSVAIAPDSSQKAISYLAEGMGD
ncbi:MAG: cysteine synthase family protein [Coriobacteriales bacterium]|nr:cysteine synthase family protein [Coriobacteriales bacterium]